MVERFRAAYTGQKVLITGNTGFKGSWLTLWLQSLGASVYGYSIDIPTRPALYKIAKIKIPMVWGDVSDVSKITRSIKKIKPDIVFHLAAQPLVRASYREPFETHRVNVMGSAAVLEALRHCPNVRAAVMITTDKVYENQEQGCPLKETDPLGGHDPYSASKAAAEIMIASYRRAFFNATGSRGKKRTLIASARAGNVIGGGDFAEDRLIPDCLKAFQSGKPVSIRNPGAVRPWQHVLEPLAGYLQLGERLLRGDVKYAGPWNFGPKECDTKPVKWIVSHLAKDWGKGARFTLDQGKHPHEAKELRLNITKARELLAWRPRWRLETALAKVVDFHKALKNREDMRKFCFAQIKEYAEACAS
ncbi:MAG: CDP-glucose 4,6-dehydratase [Candidatus Omnitrophota bacterium]